MICLLRSATVKLPDVNVVLQMSSYYIQHFCFELLNGAAGHVGFKSQIYPFYFEKFAPLPVVVDVADNLILVRLVEKILL